MEGKYSLKHLYNNGKPSQLKPAEFIELMTWLDENTDGTINENQVEVTEKIDGSSNFIGLDDNGLFVEKFGFNQRMYKQQVESHESGAKAAALYNIIEANPDIKNFLDDLRKENNCHCIKAQIEVVFTQFSKNEDYVQIVLVPYKKELLGATGNGFVIQVLNGDTLEPINGEQDAIMTLCDIMSTDEFRVTGTQPKHYEPIDIKDDIQEVKDILADIADESGLSIKDLLASRKRADKEYKDKLKSELSDCQEALQDKLTDAFPSGDYGDYYEGLVFKLENGMMFKVTSKKFKQFMANHQFTESVKIKDIDMPDNYLNDCHEAISIMANHIKPDVSINFYIMKKDKTSSKLYIKLNNSEIKSNEYDPRMIFDDECLDSQNKLNDFVIKTDNVRPDKIQYFYVRIGNEQKELKLESTSGRCQALEVVSYENGSLGNYTQKSSTGTNGTSIQEAMYGVLLDTIIKNETRENGEKLTAEYISEKIKSLYNDPDLSATSNIKEKLGIKTSQDYKILNLSANELKNNFPENWVTSVSYLFLPENTTAIKNLVSFENPNDTALLHENVFPVFKDANIASLWPTLVNNLMSQHYKSRRDVVNPSDIYFVDITKKDALINFNKSIKAKMLETEYSAIHNKAQNEGLFKGISLKEPGKNIHTDYISIENPDATYIKIDCENPQNSTIDLVNYSLEYSWATTKGKPHQGQLYIIVPFILNGVLDKAKLQIKSNGNPTATIEAMLQSGKAQLGKGKSMITGLINGAFALQEKIKGLNQSKLEEALLELYTEGETNNFAKGNYNNIKQYIDNSTSIATIQLPSGSKYSYYKSNPEISITPSNQKPWYKINLEKINPEPTTLIYKVDKDIRKNAILITNYIVGKDVPSFIESEIDLNELEAMLHQKDSSGFLNIIFRLSVLFSICSKYPIEFIGDNASEYNRVLQNSKFNSKIVNYYKIS